jgi:hypothetical protein
MLLQEAGNINAIPAVCLYYGTVFGYIFFPNNGFKRLICFS